MIFDDIQAVYQAAMAKHGDGAGVDALLTSAEGRAWLRVWADRTQLLMQAERVRKLVAEAEAQ